MGCQTRGLRVSGTKLELAKRLLEEQAVVQAASSQQRETIAKLERETEASIDTKALLSKRAASARIEALLTLRKQR